MKSVCVERSVPPVWLRYIPPPFEEAVQEWKDKEVMTIVGEDADVERERPPPFEALHDLKVPWRASDPVERYAPPPSSSAVQESNAALSVD